MRIGVDTGGTFTDFVILTQDGISILKLPSTENPAWAVSEGLSRIVEKQSGFLVQHGSTVATNALLERKGAQTLLITNEGFEDLIEIGRQNRPGLYDLSASKPEPLVSRRMRIGFRERTGADGSQIVAIENKSLGWLRNQVKRLSPESVAVVLLYSYLKPENELKVAEALGSFDLPISLSHQILPEFREYERTSTTTINAYVQPIMDKYLSALETDETLKKGRLTVMQSNGGSMSVKTAKKEPVRTLFSGPAGGVVGAFEVAQAAGYDRIISFDMGGTSTDVSLCDRGIATTNEAKIDNLPISVRMIDIYTVGAGGGSIGWIDEGGLLRVGPQSAGAEPGPVCYGKGDQITVTDCNLFLGRMEADYFLGGEKQLFPEKIPPVLENVGKHLEKATQRKWELHEVAEGVIQIANTQIENALRLISLRRGFDTRDFTLLTFGGAGGLHACSLARSLRIPRILIPKNPGTLSAMGILRAAVTKDASRTVMLDKSEENLTGQFEAHYGELESQVRDELDAHGFQSHQMAIEKSVDVRYRGQAYEINIPYSSSLEDDFHKHHKQIYGYSSPGVPLEFVNLRVQGRASYPQPDFPSYSREGEDPPMEALIQEKKVYLDGEVVPTRFYIRNRLRCGNRVSGPAIVLEYSSTTLIPPDFWARIDEMGSIVIESAE